MSLNLKLRTCFITFILVISSFSYLTISSNTVKAEDFFDGLDEILSFLQLIGDLSEDIFKPHPYRIIGAHYINETINIKGDIGLDLFFSSTLLTQLGEKYKDRVNISLYQYNYEKNKLISIDNGNLTFTLEPEKFGETIQITDNIKLINVNHTLDKGDYLLISIELIQAKKPIFNYIEKRYEKKIKNRVNTLLTYLNNSDNPELSQISGMVKDIFSAFEEAGIDSEDVADLANSFRSSSFYYGSDLFKSSIFVPLDNSKGNKTLYFYNTPNELDEVVSIAMGSIKNVNTTKPTSDLYYAWPPLLLSTDLDLNIEDLEWFNWFIIWLIYNMEGIVYEDEEIVTYYLTKDKKLTLNEPTSDSPSRFTLSKTPIKWDGIELQRNKIIVNASAELYLHYPRLIALRKVSINATLYDETEGKVIGTAVNIIDRTTLFELLRRGPDSPTYFTFNNAINKEIWNNHNISLRVSEVQGPLFSLRPSRIVCDSYKYPSQITLKLKETDNIKLEKISDKKIIPGGSAEIILKITSKYEDNIKIEAAKNISKNPDHFSIEYPNSISVDANSTTSISVFINSTENSSSAYGDYLNVIYNVTGSTGIDQKDSTVTVHTDAVDVDFEIIAPKNKKIKQGEKGTYKFIIRNLNNGFLIDTYIVEAISEHGWEVIYENSIDNLEPYVLHGKEYILNITLIVPEDADVSSDTLDIKISSEEARIKNAPVIKTKTVITKVISLNIFEIIYKSFESIAEDIGLDDVLGSYAAAFLLFIIVFVILILLIIIVYIMKKKFIAIICLDRIKDINPDEEAIYEIAIRNPSKKVLNYKIRSEMVSESKGFDVSLDKESVMVGPNQSKKIVLTVRPTDYVKSNDWIEVRLIVNIVEKEKSSEISIITTIKGGKPKIILTSVLHWPRVFYKDDKVETSFRLFNNGNVSASNVNVTLYINGKEKNKVEDITIPRGGYAKLEIPWIAVKGKNKVDIVVK
ncbi:hypothetical protein AYK24_05150 [Thermoplasmatales archaeon SG8-52-4]|nr:MAG: hypothetical protein AYK24_05150 [Thermoplasmatales archaeon SG8-52-4]